MLSIHQTMSQDHRRCDDMFVEAQKFAARKDWTAAIHYTDLFIRNELQHFNHEETVLFPAFEQAAGMMHGSTEIMREEHKTLRELFEDLRQASIKKNPAQFLGIAETLFIFLQQHNMKEENILYPMMDQQCQDHDMQQLCRLHKTISHVA